MATSKRLRRKTYVTYPPNYSPGDGYKKAASVLQAKKQATRFGVGSTITVVIHTKARQDEPFFGGGTEFRHLMELV